MDIEETIGERLTTDGTDSLVRMSLGEAIDFLLVKRADAESDRAT